VLQYRFRGNYAEQVETSQIRYQFQRVPTFANHVSVTRESKVALRGDLDSLT